MQDLNELSETEKNDKVKVYLGYKGLLATLSMQSRNSSFAFKECTGSPKPF